MSEINSDPRGSSKLIVRPNEVKGFQTTHEAKPNRYFYVLCGDECWECDGYRAGDPSLPDDHGDVHWAILLTCPVCHQALKLDSTKKQIKVWKDCGLETAEPIRCSYPAQFSGPCPFGVVLELPSKKADKFITVHLDGGITKQIAIDAVAKRV